MSEPIQHTSERLLEFDHLRELLAVYAASPLGKGRIAALAPSKDRVWIGHGRRQSSGCNTSWRASYAAFSKREGASTPTACSIPRS